MIATNKMMYPRLDQINRVALEHKSPEVVSSYKFNTGSPLLGATVGSGFGKIYGK